MYDVKVGDVCAVGVCSLNSQQFQGENIKVSPEEVSSAILMNMKEIAEDYTGKTVVDAVITVPGLL